MKSIIREDISRLLRLVTIRLKRMGSNDRAGIYITVIFHLTVIIVLAISQISTLATAEKSFVFDFSRQEAMEKEVQEKAFREDISRKLDEMIRNASVKPENGAEIRNIAVDAGSMLKDDRGTDAEKLYEDADRVSEELKGGRKQAIEEDMRDEAVELPDSRRKKEDSREYKGPSVVSYKLAGRKASHLSIPAYRCMGGGEVTVAITVDNAGIVTNAKIVENVSSDDRCLRDFAVRAARLSRFSRDPKASPRQAGEIVYRFIAQ